MKDLPEATAQLDDRLRVFLSYSRDDLAFVNQLEPVLTFLSYEVIIDRHGIAPGEDWKTRLGTMLREADTVVFVLSPASATSDVCAWEVDEAVRLGKRIIPVLCRSLEGTRPPEALANLNYIFFYDEPRSPGSGFGTGQVKLAAALNTDLDWLREHTRLLQRATEWDTDGRPDYRLLSGGEISEAKDWIARHPKDAPDPTALQLDFIRASEAAEENRHNTERQRLEEMAAAQAERAKALEEQEAAQRREAEQSRKVVRRTFVGLVAALILAAAAGGAGLYAWQQQKEAVEQQRLAEEARNEAVAQQTLAETLAETARIQSEEATAQRDRANAALARIFAERSISIPTRRDFRARALAIRYAIVGSRLSKERDVGNRAALAVALNGLTISIADLGLFRGSPFADFRPIPGTERLLVANTAGEVALIDMTGVGQKHRDVARESGRIIWDLHYTSKTIEYLTVDPTGTFAAIVGLDRGIWLLNLDQQKVIAKIPGEEVDADYNPVNNPVTVVFNRGGTRVFVDVRYDDEPAKILDTLTGRQVADLGETGIQNPLAVFSHDDRYRIVGEFRGFNVFDARSDQLLDTLQENLGTLTAVAFSPDGRWMATAVDRTLTLWEVDSEKSGSDPPFRLLQQIELERRINKPHLVHTLLISRDVRRVYAVSYEGVRVWDVPRNRIVAQRIDGKMGSVVLKQTGTYAAINGRQRPRTWDNRIWIWDTNNGQFIVGLRVVDNTGKRGDFIVRWSDSRLMVANPSGIDTFDLDALEEPLDKLIAEACSDEWLLKKDLLRNNDDYTRFTVEDLRNDPLIREAWDPEGVGRSVCDSG